MYTKQNISIATISFVVSYNLFTFIALTAVEQPFDHL